MKASQTLTRVGLLATTLGTLLCAGSAHAQDWPEIFDPNQLLTLNLTMDPNDWDVVRYDWTFDIEKPAQFWADGESPILVSVRRKSCDALPNESDPFKVSLKIDINEYVPGQVWHGLRKVSLENGDDVDVVAEGLACYLHQMASGPEGYAYDPGRVCWVELNVNSVNRGVYVSQENVDQKFQENRAIYIYNATWLYKSTGQGEFELKVGDEFNVNSPGVEALCYEPFVCTVPSSPHYPPGGPCPTPSDPNELVADVDEWVNVQAMLTNAAVSAFVANPDALFTNYQNDYFLDFNLNNPLETRKRWFFPWDRDMVMCAPDYDIYDAGPATTWQTIILGNPTFRAQYNQIMTDLLNGPLSEAEIHGFLDTVEPILTDALAADQYNQFPTPGTAGVAERFDEIRDWYSARITEVLAQIQEDLCSAQEPGDTNGDGSINGLDIWPFVEAVVDPAQYNIDRAPLMWECTADINCDGSMNGLDISPFVQCLTIGCPICGAEYTLTINITGNGSVSVDPNQPTYTYGTPVTMTAAADPSWSFDYWDGDASGSDNPKTIVMDRDKTVTAVFVED